ncbi:MAG: SEC-C metal-binding domain-containing protein [Bacillota bacterium]|nr:SEC-C metal-binding domain-containing protein [Bacillota bacterium]
MKRNPGIANSAKAEHDKVLTKMRLPGGIVRKTKIGGNDPCPCGSGKKYKKCCQA